MQSLRVARLLLVGAWWRLSGSARAGRTLVRGLAGGREREQVVAGMILGASGERAQALLRAEIAAGDPAPNIVTLLGDVGDTGRSDDQDVLQALAEQSEDVGTRRAAVDALRVLRLRGKSADEDAAQ